MLLRWFICVVFMALAYSGFSQNTGVSTAKKDQEGSTPYFISRKNGIYGLGDTSGWYINTPVGDSLFHIGNRHFAVRKHHKLYDIYNEEFKVLHSNIKTVEEFGTHVLLKDSIGWMISSLMDMQTSPYFDSVQIHQEYVWTFKKGKQGIIHKTWSLNEMIAADYDQVGPYYEGVLLMNHGKLGWKELKGISIPVEYDHIYKERNDIIAAKNNKGTVYFSLYYNHRLLIEPDDSVVFYRNFYKRVRGSHQSVFQISDNTLVGEVTGYHLHPFSFENVFESQTYCIVEKDSVCALFEHGKFLTGFDYENFLPASEIEAPYFRIVKDQKVGVINKTGEYQLRPLYTDVIEQRGDYYIARVGNRLGLFLKGDSVIIPANFQCIRFYNEKYAYMSYDGRLFGLYNVTNRKQITTCKYQEFDIDSVFVLARQGNLFDVFFHEDLKFTDLYDALANKNTVKGYKEGRVHIGYVRKNIWEEYSYEIPSYKVVSERTYSNDFKAFNYVNEHDIYDYSVGKWGNYSYNSQTWLGKPLAHSGDSPEGNWLLGFYRDSSFTWSGLNFQSIKKLSPIQTAWQAKSKYSWIDTRSHGYSSSDGMENIFLTISPICYTSPGQGTCFDNYKPATINHVFYGNTGKSIMAENGKIEIATYGDISLSDYFTQLNSNGALHPKSISDYQKIINPNYFIKINGATEHVLHKVNRNKKRISIANSFDWVNKKQLNPLVFKVVNKYGLLSDSSEYLLKPEYESIESVKLWGSVISKVGVRSQACKLYDPKTNLFSKTIEMVLNTKDELLLIQLEDGQKAVINIHLDTLIKTNFLVTLIGGKDFCVKETDKTCVFRGKEILFTHLGNSTEKINDTHFLIHADHISYIAGQKGDTLFKSRKLIKYLPLDAHFLLEDGSNYTLFDKNDKAITHFEKLHYVTNDDLDLIIKDEKSVTIFERNSSNKITLNGKFVKATKNYIILDLGKYKNVYTLNGKLLQGKVKNAKVINDEYVSYQTGKKYFLFNVSTLEQIKVKSLNTNLSKEGIEYDAVDETQQMIVFKNTDSLYIKEYRGLFGLRSDSLTVLPCRYFQIQKLSDMYLVQDQIEYKLFNHYTRRFISDQSFDSVYPYKNYLMVLKKGEPYYLDVNKTNATLSIR